MHRYHPFSAKASWLGFAVLLLLVATGCDSVDSEPASSRIVVMLDHRVGGEPLTLDEIRYTNAAGNRYGVTLVEYILTNIALHKADGTQVSLRAAHYVNAAAGATHRIVVEEVPAGTYTGVSFTVGVMGPDNTFGSLPNTTDFANMAWAAQMGGGTTRYHYMRFEGRYEQAEGVLATFLVHTGPTGGNDNAVSLTLAADFTLDGHDGEIRVQVDLDAWLDEPNVYDFRTHDGMIMGNQATQAMLQANGASVFSIRAMPAPEPVVLRRMP
jgi:hypothetical protein